MSFQPARIMIIGANGGIGAALLAAAAERWPDSELIGSARNPPSLSTAESASASPTAIWLSLDLTDEASLASAAQSAAQLGPLDLVVVASGWLHDDDHQPEKSLRQLSAAAFQKAFAINASGPLLLMKHLDPLLTRSRGTESAGRARVLVLSAKVGSISDNGLGGWHAYRMAKAALNMGIRNLGLEYSRNERKPLIAAVHPGTTESALSAPFAKRGLPVVSTATSAERLLDFAAAMDGSEQGGFFHWDRQPLPY